MQYIWVESGPGEVPPGAVVGGKMADGRVLYTAQVKGEAGQYDPTKSCAEYIMNRYRCESPWKILVTYRRDLHCECFYFP